MDSKVHPAFERVATTETAAPPDDMIFTNAFEKLQKQEGSKPNMPALLINDLNVKSKGGAFILSGINMEAEFGEITAIMGPSGSGKTTLLNYIADIRSGNLKYQGKKYVAADFKYVPQEDHLHGFMTVEKYMNNYFGLNYGFKKSKDAEDLRKIRSLILKEMHLSNSFNSKVGDIFQHGLSGGERRRLSIALELVSRPLIIILDEPTSGLDSYAAEKVMYALKGLALNEKIAVITTIHQPNSRIFQIIDKLLFLKDGQIKYQAPTIGINRFFLAQGENEWESYNPADQALELLDRKEVLPLPFQLNFRPEHLVKQSLERQGQDFKRATNLHKFLFLTYRNLQNIFLNPAVIGIRILMYTFLCLLIGGMYWRLGESFDHESVMSRSSLLFYVGAFLVFMSISALPPFMMERAIFEKEINNKLYHPFIYQLSNWMVSWVGIGIISITSTICLYYLAEINGLSIFLVNLFLSLLVAEALVNLVAIVVPHYIIGMAFVAGIFGFFMVCEGYLVNKDDIPPYFAWGYYLAFHTYTLRVFMWNEFENIEAFHQSKFKNGKEVLSFYKMQDVEVAQDLAILVSYVIAIQALIFIIMFIKYKN